MMPGIIVLRWKSIPDALLYFFYVSNLLRNKESDFMKNKEIRKLTRIGKRSIGLTLPIEVVRELGWKERQKVVAKRVRGGIIIRDYRKK